MEMGRLNKFFFWFFIIILAFMPYGIIMSFAILLLYYGVPYIKSELKDVCNDCSDTTDERSDIHDEKESSQFYDDETLEEMK